MGEDFNQAQKNVKTITEKVELKTWKDTVKKIYKKLHPIKRKEKLYSIKKDIESEHYARIQREFEPKIDLKKSGKKGLLNCKLELEFGHEFKKSNIIIDVNVNGEMFKLMSREGSTDFNMYYGVAKRF